MNECIEIQVLNPLRFSRYYLGFVQRRVTEDINQLFFQDPNDDLSGLDG